MAFLDIGIIVIVVLGALIGLWKGFFKSLISFFGWFASFLAAFFLTKPIADALLDVGSINGFVVGTDGWSLYSWILGKLPDLSSGGAWATVLRPLIAIAESVMGATVEEKVAMLLANGVFSILVCVALLLAIRLLLLLLTMFANAMTQDKLVGAINRLLGLLVGAVKGFGFVCVVMVIFTFIMGLSFMAPVQRDMDKSLIAAPVYKQVATLTDKFVTGGKGRLEKLLHLSGKDEEGEEEAPAYAGRYNGADPDGDAKYVFDLRADGTFTVTTLLNGSSERNGTYAVNGDTVTFTYALSEGQETADVESGTLGDGWIYLWDMYFAKDGVDVPDTPPETTPPEGGGEETPPEEGGEEGNEPAPPENGGEDEGEITE